MRGQVESITTSTLEDGYPVTHWTLLVLEELKGDVVSNRINYRIPGGPLPGDYYLTVSGTPTAAIGDELLLFAFVIDQQTIGSHNWGDAVWFSENGYAVDGRRDALGPIVDCDRPLPRLMPTERASDLDAPPAPPAPSYLFADAVADLLSCSSEGYGAQAFFAVEADLEEEEVPAASMDGLPEEEVTP